MGKEDHQELKIALEEAMYAGFKDRSVPEVPIYLDENDKFLYKNLAPSWRAVGRMNFLTQKKEGLI